MDAVLGWNLVLSLPVILAIAWLAGRLLGVSRSWAGTVRAGVAGWLAALALSLAIAEGDTAAPGFTRNLWVFAAVFTMSASVWVELLAKPGALARASRRLSRYAQITGIAVKHGFGPLLGLGPAAADDPAAPPATPAARRLRLALEECGGMFVKLGQVLSTRADLLPAGVVTGLVQRGNLQARVRLLADEEDVRTVTRLLSRVVLAGLVGLLSVMLLGTQGGPHFTGDTSLFQFFGYFGLFCATALILRVIVAILRDGLN